jgi:hypothetical protein
MSEKIHSRAKLMGTMTMAFLSLVLLAAAGERGAAAIAQPQSPSSSPPEGWLVECIDCLRYFTGMSGSSAALDSSGLVHTAYGGDSLYYAAQNSDDTFQTEVVDDNPRRGVNATMVLDSSDRTADWLEPDPHPPALRPIARRTRR